MSSLSSIYLKKETLQTLLDVVSKKGEKGVELTIAINDDTNEYGQNLSSYVSQTKDQRDAGIKRFYVGNGKCFWTDGSIKTAVKPDNIEVIDAVEVKAKDDDFPF